MEIFTPLNHVPSPRPPSYYWAPSKRRCINIHRLNSRITGYPPQTIVPSSLRMLTESRRTPDILEQIGGIFGRKVHPIIDLSCLMSISTVLPVLAHRQQKPVLSPPTELLCGERKIRRPPVGIWGRMKGWNAWSLRFSLRPSGGLSMLFYCGGV